MQFIILYTNWSLFFVLLLETFFAVFYIFPAWVANATPVIFGGGTPLDFGKKIGGKPIFGSHKTVRGTVAGLAAGYLVALVQPNLIATYSGSPVIVGFALTTGAIFGDLFGSFIKRRFGVKEGIGVPVMDQYMFLVFALLFALPFGVFPDYIAMAIIVVLTGTLHVLLNKLAYRVHIKKVPW